MSERKTTRFAVLEAERVVTVVDDIVYIQRGYENFEIMGGIQEQEKI